MNNMQKRVYLVSFILLFQTIIWLIITIISMSQVANTWNNLDFVKWVANPDVFFKSNYINALLLTVIVVILFTYLYGYLKENNYSNSIVGLIFVPIYGLLNIIAYSIQISIVPEIAHMEIVNNFNNGFAQYLIQANPNSLIGFLNGLAYAILGIPSIIFGYELIQNKKKMSGIFLAVSGICGIVGIVGYILKNTLLSNGAMVSGVFFLVSLIFLVIEFRRKKT